MRITKIRLLVAIGGVVAALSLLLRPHPPDNGNTFVALSSSGPDYVDPGLAYTALAWQMMFDVYNGLLTYKRVAGKQGNTLVPDLAQEMPKVSADGKVYTFKMRRGIKFGPPVNREVLPSDQAWGIERLFKLPSPGVGYFLVIDGTQEFMDGKAKSVRGIIADDKAGTIEFHLTQPDATFPYKLATMFAVAVPKEVPAKDQSNSGFVPATGPYQFTNYTPQRNITMKRNPSFKPWTREIPDGHVDRITIQLGPAADNSITKIRKGDADYSLDGVGSTWLPRLRRDAKWKKHLHKEISPATSYFFLNTQVPPFDNLKVREAMNFAIDRRALVKLTGGRAVPTENILPPLMPGYREHNLYPGPDLERAKKLIAESGVKPGKIAFWCVAADGPNPQAEYMQDTLQKLGFTVEIKCLDYAVYVTTVMDPKKKVQIGTSSWVQDFPEATSFIDPLLNGANITPVSNNNNAMYSGADKEIAEAMALQDMDEREKAWADLDEKIMRDAPWVPYSNPVSWYFTNPRVKGYIAHPVYGMVFSNVRVKDESSASGGTA